MSEPENVPPGVDTRTPSVARMYDYYLGGKDNFAVDRESADKVLRLFPEVRQVAQENRAFLGRAVRMLAEAGMDQFLDIGTGLPTRENVHQVALAAHPDARVVYVDNDPIVLAHARALLADNPRTVVIEGDLRDPKAIMEHPTVRGHLDTTRPYAVILCAIVHFIADDQEAAGIVAQLRDGLPTGGALVLSHAFPGDVPEEGVGELSDVYRRTRDSLALRDRRAIEGFFSGLELVEPGVVHVGAWRPEVAPAGDPSTGGLLGGVGLVPAGPA
ncbi:hypothetical protein Sru01_31870 [Sphaerisporangium rufum]|uniref:SAM-dependent methyltransferase n=1 Tax=Sphaerisporangium rufum TaxID=1381558 RepID=A0A919R4J3_9ACTN|nr:SAM-dependent methyltransferase [Sphaerisporangium rufum]GII78205.1 hypothetical protein Sru01_31870 [Sphaerisporangium rufum]